MPGATTEVATLKQALSEAENKVAKERIERERHEARVGEVQQELHALMTKHEALELNVGDISYRELIGRPTIRGKSASLSAYRPIYRHIG